MVVLFIARDVFEASPEGGLERGFLLDAGCGSESEDESEGEKNCAELHFSFEKRLGDGMRGKRGKGFVFRSKVVGTVGGRNLTFFQLSLENVQKQKSSI